MTSLSSLPCTTLKTLTITYSSGSVMPSAGYTIQWRVVGSSDWFTEPNKRANPITIPGVPSCYPLEIKLLADCGTGLQVVETFGVQGTASTLCYTYQLLDSAQYTYTPCGSTNPVSIYNSTSSISTQQLVCAVNGSLGGGRYTRMDQCLGTQA